MIQCTDCEFFVQGPQGQVGFKCNPFTNIKEPECLYKWQLVKVDVMATKINTMAGRIDSMVRAYQATLAMYEKLAPLQEKMFKHMEREIDDIDEADNWKYTADDDEEEEEDEEDEDEALS